MEVGLDDQPGAGLWEEAEGVAEGGVQHAKDVACIYISSAKIEQESHSFVSWYDRPCSLANSCGPVATELSQNVFFWFLERQNRGCRKVYTEWAWHGLTLRRFQMRARAAASSDRAVLS